ncbi:hypothetical protein C900_04474 [Fulvivirga imtechensis AK7]|uniref:Resolvase HTH domain-containing protein n=1 Tax=Fulvivirga imtechensis AK7 TaxID=1237149 RepID=L8JLY9_9BACT|nr:hypothetical protein [Fulvivirga imtechensis]ELR69951.1 hypothetical protein C900_04474 [Fulvivirga imtechensis AK7]
MKLPGEASVERTEIIRAVQALYGTKPTTEIREQFGLSKATFYRYLKVDLSKYQC